jgi:hypothetical protein
LAPKKKAKAKPKKKAEKVNPTLKDSHVDHANNAAAHMDAILSDSDLPAPVEKAAKLAQKAALAVKKEIH